MQPPHGTEFLVRERLRSNAQTIYTHGQGASQELHIGRAWSDFNCEFAAGLDPKTRAESTNNPLESFRPEQRRGSSPEIDCVHPQYENLFAKPINLKVGGQPVDFLFQRVAISVEET